MKNIAAAALLLLALAPMAMAASHRGYTMDVPAAGVRSISFDVQEGDLIIRGDPSATAVHMRVAIDRYWLFRLGEAGILQRLIKITGEGTPQIAIATDIQPSWRNYGRAEYPIDIEVVVPANAVLNIRDTSGIIEVTGINSAVEINDTSGTVTVRRVKGPLNLSKESGDVRVEDVAGSVTIGSRSGQMQFRRVGELNVTASDGNLNVTDAGSARLVSKGGNVHVTAIRGNVNIDNESGEIEISQVSGNVVIHDTSGQIRATNIGALLVDDTSGDVVVNGARSVIVRSKESGQVKLRNVSGEVQVPAGITLARR